MINIDHPKLHGKPPLSGSLKEVQPRKEETLEDRVAYKIEDPTDAMKLEKADYNRNVVHSTTCSFEHLCSMISELEKDMTGKLPETDRLQLEPERDVSEGKRATHATTYDDIVSFLTNLEEGSSNEAKANVSQVDCTILEEMFGNSQDFPCVVFDSVNASNIGTSDPRTFKEDLATAQLQLEEKNATISLVKEQLKSERKLSCEKLEDEKRSNACKLRQQEEKYKGMVKRHQKFIEQLITQKTELTEKCHSLAQKVKEIEIKMQRDLKAVTDRHTVELQRAKEHFAAAEKIKRERWIEARTTKIKEMTVRGLEPELRNMMEQHSEEIQRLRNVHAKELQDSELRIVRRSNQQLEQLRLELTASHERTLTNEKNILWARYQEKLQEQENQFKAQQMKLAEELQQDREKFEKEQVKRDAEREASLQRMRSLYQQEIETLKRQHSNEKTTLQESLKAEWESWLADYKRQQNFRIQQAEDKIRSECNRERDRQIELAIERLEKDCREAKLVLRESFDWKFRSLKEKFQTDLQTALENEQLYRSKFTQTKDKLEKAELQLQETESKLRECVSELSNASEVIQRVTVERENAKLLARQEIEQEKRELEEKIASLYQEITRINVNRDTSMAQLHSRIKLIITQKLLTIKNLTKEVSDAKLKCEHLEKLLDQQRREYILKSL